MQITPRNQYRIYINEKVAILVSILCLMGISFLLSNLFNRGKIAQANRAKVNCSFFSSQKAAQAFYEKDRKTFGYLDRAVKGVKDGKACQSYPYKDK